MTSEPPSYKNQSYNIIQHYIMFCAAQELYLLAYEDDDGLYQHDKIVTRVFFVCMFVNIVFNVQKNARETI